MRSSACSVLDAFHLARIQFAFTVSFHIIFPAITIGLASYLAVLEGLWLKSKNPVYRSLYHFWSKIFAVNFGMGVVSGLVMAYQFGTNWSGFSQFAGSITGPLLTYEVLTAFFLEAGFLGVMLFGWNRVGPGLHFFATCMVALRHHHLHFLDPRLQTAGCKLRRALRSTTARSSRLTGWRWSLTPLSLIACCICRWRRS
ncbi:Cytochrome d ubiquinol oxidase subunit 1 [Cedecea neteri]|uniref:Cytochrome d ubiquinol oxidase subunit 1 n=1 Tax=Cedecea neteri TaxID=158822 RepID=A0A2X3J264_9ENTR|nr:Cytochrome d ubiquinol oxidase subunit 1 [Cedecea neteri]